VTEHLPGIIRRAAGSRAGDGKTVTLQACPPGVVDDYGSVWTPRTFDESLKRRLPVLCWGHDWSNPLGPGVEHQATSSGPVIKFRFSDFDAVPEARRAYAQVLDGTITDCSVGFSGATRRDPTHSEQQRFPGVREVIEKANLDEVSLVLRGAVPDAKVLAVRSARETIDEDFLMGIARKIASGEWTHARAYAEVERLSTPSRSYSAPTPSRRFSSSEYAQIEAEIDEALDRVSDSVIDATLRGVRL
jgi:HK97 family phage prohead protease